MGRLRPGVSTAQAQAALAPRFHQWVAATAKTDGERAKRAALIQSTRPDVMRTLKNGRGGGPRRRALHVLVVAQIAISFLILAAAGLFVALHSRIAGAVNLSHPARAEQGENLGVSSATLSQSSIVNAGRVGLAIRGPMKIGAVTIEDARVLAAGRWDSRSACLQR